MKAWKQMIGAAATAALLMAGTAPSAVAAPPDTRLYDIYELRERYVWMNDLTEDQIVSYMHERCPNAPRNEFNIRGKLQRLDVGERVVLNCTAEGGVLVLPTYRDQ